MEKSMKIIKSQDNKHIAFVQEDIVIACLDLIKLKEFLNNDTKDVERFTNEVVKV